MNIFSINNSVFTGKLKTICTFKPFFAGKSHSWSMLNSFNLRDRVFQCSNFAICFICISKYVTLFFSFMNLPFWHFAGLSSNEGFISPSMHDRVLCGFENPFPHSIFRNAPFFTTPFSNCDFNSSGNVQSKHFKSCKLVFSYLYLRMTYIFSIKRIAFIFA